MYECAPRILRARRAVLLLPAGLRNKTTKERREYARDWKTASPPARMISFEGLAREEHDGLLASIRPDLIMIDEADEGSNWDAAWVQAVDRYVWSERAAHGPQAVRVIAGTGTPSRKSILGYWHILRWCLGDGAPVPASRADAEVWAAALDEGTPRSGWRPSPGALGETLAEARTWYRDRLRLTPGVLIVDEDSAAGVPLRIDLLVAPRCRKIERAFRVLRTKELSPSGEPVSDPLSLYRIENDLGCGLFRYLDPPPPEAWVRARRRFAKFVRATIRAQRHAFHPPRTMAAVARRNAAALPVAEWYAVRDEYDVSRHTRVEWLSDATLEWAAEWLHAGAAPSILWSGNVEFGERLAEVAGLPYFGREGLDRKRDRELHSATTAREPRFVCSWHANKRGFNLQPWRRNGLIVMPQSAKYLEQTIGRPHRQGQIEAVSFTILATSGLTYDVWDAALAEAAFVKETATLTEKILRAKIAPFPEPPDTLRWARRGADEEDEEGE